MPIHRVSGGYKWGNTGKIYPTKKQTEKQAADIYSSGWREKKGNTKKKK